ncbi:MAG: CDP-alcohol phosphatidyltransferase family protein [Rhodospirillales bacterium]|nr:CDP-alcohol phosphatidyltransferase family protein [Rhodospirillales bacterium]
MTLADETSPDGSVQRIPFDQRLARLLVRPLAATPVTPNQITALSLLLGLLGAWLFARGGSAIHWGALLFVLATFIDHADGELARMTGRTSRFGHVFDHLTGGTIHVMLFIGIGVGLMEGPLGLWGPILGLSTGVSVAAIFLLRFEVARRCEEDSIQQPYFAGFEIEDIMYVVAPVTWLGGLLPFLVLAGIGTPFFLALEVWTHRRKAKAVRADVRSP